MKNWRLPKLLARPYTTQISMDFGDSDDKKAKNSTWKDFGIATSACNPPAINVAMEGRFLKFRPLQGNLNFKPSRSPDKGFYFRLIGAEPKLIRYTLEDNGFHEEKQTNKFSILWSSSGLRSSMFQGLNKFQKLNHFPRTSEITKKDSLYKNIARMQSIHGKKNFDFLPETYILPQDTRALAEAMDSSRNMWIIKPSGSS